MLAKSIDELLKAVKKVEKEYNEIRQMDLKEREECVKKILQIKVTVIDLPINEEEFILKNFHFVCKMTDNPVKRIMLLENEAILFSRKYGFSYDTVSRIIHNKTLSSALTDYNYFILEAN